MVGVGAVSGVLGEGATDMNGVLCGLGAALLYASVMIMNKFMGDVPSYERTVVQLFVAGVVVLPYAILTMGQVQITKYSVILLVIVGVVHTGFAYLLYFGAVKNLKSKTTAILSYIDPASAILLSSLVFMKIPTIYEFIGVVLIMTGAIWSELGNKK
jgi:drug/metabolite transporter (DMT)-like permease